MKEKPKFIVRKRTQILEDSTHLVSMVVTLHLNLR